MASFASVLKDEITRLSRKEARKLIEPVRNASVSYRHEIAALKRQVTLLQRQVTVLGQVGKKTAETESAATSTRFVAKGLISLRARLGLSQPNFGKLAGVSGQTIFNWENGKSVPRKPQLVVLAGLRSLGKREAQERLARFTAKASKKAQKTPKR